MAQNYEIYLSGEYRMELEKLITRQAEVENQLNYPMDVADNGIKESLLALIVEATEVLDEINWKPWKLSTKVVDKVRLRGELADCFLFWALAVNYAEIKPVDMAIEITCKQKKAVKRHHPDNQ